MAYRETIKWKATKVAHKIWVCSSSLLYHNVLFSYIIKVKFTPLLHNYLLKATEIKYLMQKQIYSLLIFVIKFNIVPTW